MAIPFIHRKYSHHAPDHPPSPHPWPVTIHVVSKRLCRVCRHLLHRSWHPVLHRDCGHRSVVISTSVPNASIGRPPVSQRQWGNPEIVDEPVSVQHHLPHLRHLEGHPKIDGEHFTVQHKLAYPHRLDRRSSEAHFCVPSYSRHHTKPVVLGSFTVAGRVWYSQHGYEGRTSSHHPTSGRSSIREREAENGPKVPKV